MNINQAAAYTVSTLALATGAVAFATVFAQTITVKVALRVLIALGTALCIAAVSAWASLRGRVFGASDKEYFEKLFSYLGIAIAAASQFITQNVFEAALAGEVKGVTTGVASLVSHMVDPNT